MFDLPARDDRASAAARPIDFDFLTAQTGGDRQLIEELLRLFAKQVRCLGKAIEHAGDDLDALVTAAHTLKGAAAAVGARDLATSAAELLDAVDAVGEHQRNRLMSQIDEACDHVASLLR